MSANPASRDLSVVVPNVAVIFTADLVAAKENWLASLADLPEAIEDSMSCAVYRAALANGKKVQDAFRSARLDVTRRLDAAKKSLMETEEAGIAEVVEAQNALQDCLLTYDTKIREEAARREAIRAAEMKDAGRITPDLTTCVEPEPEVGKVHVVETAKVRVVDESLLPAEYWKRVPDLEKIEAAYAAKVFVPGTTVDVKRTVSRK